MQEEEGDAFAAFPGAWVEKLQAAWEYGVGGTTTLQEEVPIMGSLDSGSVDSPGAQEPAGIGTTTHPSNTESSSNANTVPGSSSRATITTTGVDVEAGGEASNDSPGEDDDHNPNSPGGSHSTSRKRKQVKNACTNCQKACKKCDDSRPCLRCVHYGIEETCADSERRGRRKGVKRGPYKKRDKKATT